MRDDVISFLKNLADEKCVFFIGEDQGA
jgi:hypothetical protein